MQEPESRSRPLHAGCRRGSKQVAPRLIPGPHTFSWFRHHLKHFDASKRVRFHSPSRSAPDAVSAASFPRRSPPRLLTGAAHGGLLPPPARRQRRACLHLSHSIASQQTAPTRPAGYPSGHTYAAAFFRNSFSIFQFPGFPLELAQPGRLIQGQRRFFAGVFTTVGAHPVTEGAFVDSELLRHSGRSGATSRSPSSRLHP